MYKNQDESHFSDELRLLTFVDNKNVSDIILTQEYWIENGSQTISTLFLDNFTFIRSTTNHYKYLHEIGKVDSTNIVLDTFIIGKNGNISESNY